MTHVNDITPRNFVEVCIDMKQQGVAGYDSWETALCRNIPYPPIRNIIGDSH